MLADRGLATQLFADIGRGREVVGVDMGIDDPLDRQALGLHKCDQTVGRHGGGPPGRGVIVQQRVDDGAGLGFRVGDHIADRVGRLIEEGRDDRIGHVQSPWLTGGVA